MGGTGEGGHGMARLKVVEEVCKVAEDVCKVIMAGHVYVPADKVLLTPLPVQ